MSNYTSSLFFLCFPDLIMVIYVTLIIRRKSYLKQKMWNCLWSLYMTDRLWDPKWRVLHVASQLGVNSIWWCHPSHNWMTLDLLIICYITAPRWSLKSFLHQQERGKVILEETKFTFWIRFWMTGKKKNFLPLACQLPSQGILTSWELEPLLSGPPLLFPKSGSTKYLRSVPIEWTNKLSCSIQKPRILEFSLASAPYTLHLFGSFLKCISSWPPLSPSVAHLLLQATTSLTWRASTASRQLSHLISFLISSSFAFSTHQQDWWS